MPYVMHKIPCTLLSGSSILHRKPAYINFHMNFKYNSSVTSNTHYKISHECFLWFITFGSIQAKENSRQVY
jgi:hypothetical protein